MFDNPSEDIQGNIYLEKTIKTIKYKFYVEVNTSKYTQELNNNIQINNNYNYEIGIEILFDDFLRIELAFKQDIGKFIFRNNTLKHIKCTV